MQPNFQKDTPYKPFLAGQSVHILPLSVSAKVSLTASSLLLHTQTFLLLHPIIVALWQPEGVVRLAPNPTGKCL